MEREMVETTAHAKKEIEFLFDFGSPNAYLAYKALPPLLARTQAAITCTPCLLGGIFKATGNQSPVFANANIKGKLAYEHLEIERFVKKHGIAFTFNPYFPINTLLIMRGAMVAARDGFLTEYIDTVFDKMWKTPKKMDDPAVVSEALSASGLDGIGVLAAAADPEIKSALIANTEQAVERGVFGLPVFFVGGEMYFGKDRMDQVEEALSGR